MNLYKLLLLLTLSLFVPFAPPAAVISAEQAKTGGNAEKKSPQPKEDYYELYKLLADTVDQVDRNYVKEVDRRELIEAAIRGVVAKLDP